MFDKPAEQSKSPEQEEPKEESPPEPELTAEQKSAQLIEELEAEKTELQAEAAKWKEEMLRAMADAENVRKRAQREVEVAKKYGVQGFAKTMLDVSDNLARSLAAVPVDDIGEQDTLLKFQHVPVC